MYREAKIFLDRILYCLVAIKLSRGFLQAQPYSELGIPNTKNYLPKEYKGHPQVFGIAQDTSGFVYFTGNGIIEYDGEIWKKIPPLGADTWSIILGNDKQIYVGATDDLGYLKADSLGQQKFVSLLPLLPKHQRNFGQLRQIAILGNAIYFASRTTGYLIQYNYTQRKVKVWKREKDITILGIVDNELYLSISDVGLCKLIGNEIKPLAEESKFANSSLVSVLPCENEKLLICTKSKGFFLYHKDKVIPFKTEADELLSNKVYFAKLLPNETFLISIIGKGVIVVDKFGKWIQPVSYTHLTLPTICSV